MCKGIVLVKEMFDYLRIVWMLDIVIGWLINMYLKLIIEYYLFLFNVVVLIKIGMF